MSKKPNTQKNKFIDAAKSIGASESSDKFDQTLGRIAKAPPPESVKKRKVVHSSDCAIHNAPAYEAGACDCGAED